MKNKLLNFYVALFCFCLTLKSYANPGENNEDGTLENLDPPASIDNNLWLIFLIGMVIVFFKFKKNTKIVN